MHSQEVLGRFSRWVSFADAYLQRTGVSHGAMFQPQLSELLEPCAGVYLIADQRLGALDDSACVIYLGSSAGRMGRSRFHDRLWKHCCKAIGECGDKSKNSAGEPRDTKRWAAYRDNFVGFDSWHFAFARVVTPNAEDMEQSAKEAERVVMSAFVQVHGAKPLCNGTSLRPPRQPAQVVFPWDV